VRSPPVALDTWAVGDGGERGGEVAAGAALGAAAAVAAEGLGDAVPGGQHTR
jgi:hypothetical protein